MKHLLILNPENVTEEELAGFAVREAARAVVVDSSKHVALLHVTNRGYYKLPGGGLEAGETKEVALGRECREEIGCDVDIIGELGSIVEYRKMFSLKQISYCYLARVQGEKGANDLTDLEMARGFEPQWLSLDEAQLAIASGHTDDLEGAAYIVPRDIAILQAAKEYLAMHSL